MRLEFCLIVALILIGGWMLIWGSSGSLDMKFYYSADEARRFLYGLSASEAANYLRNEWVDLGFLSTYSALFFVLARRFYPSKPILHFWAIVPGLFDLIETVTIIWLLLYWKAVAPPAWLGVMTCLKWLSGASISLLILAAMIRSRS